MNIRFMTAVGEGFEAGDLVLLSNGSAMVGLGASIEREEPLAREESVELRVRVPDVRRQTVEEIELAAFDRAIMIIEAARENLVQKRQGLSQES